VYINKPLRKLTLENWSLRVLIDCNNSLRESVIKDRMMDDECQFMAKLLTIFEQSLISPYYFDTKNSGMEVMMNSLRYTGLRLIKFL